MADVASAPTIDRRRAPRCLHGAGCAAHDSVPRTVRARRTAGCGAVGLRRFRAHALRGARSRCDPTCYAHLRLDRAHFRHLAAHFMDAVFPDDKRGH